MTSGPAGASPAGAEVLVVDDDADNRLLLSQLLAADDVHVSEAADGREALRLVAERHPDVVLLDVLMPGMDGVEVCRRIKDDPKTAAVPVILVTAQRGRAEQLAGIGAGASDFLTKPVDAADLRLRVRNAVSVKRLYDRVEREYERIHALERHRDGLVQMLVHDLRSPLTGIVCELELLQNECQRVLHPDLVTCVGGAIESARRLSHMIESILDVNRLEAGVMPLDLTEIDVANLLQCALTSMGPASFRVRIDAGDDVLRTVAWCDPELIRRVLVNLLSNALDHSPADEVVTVSVEQREGVLRFAVTDRGSGIPLEYQEKIFQKYGTVDRPDVATRRPATGLGLAFCRLAIEAHTREIGVISDEGAGSTFWFELCVHEVEAVSCTEGALASA